MATKPIIWAHNPGFNQVKDAWTTRIGTKETTTPYPAVLAPDDHLDDSGLSERQQIQRVTVDGRSYLGGAAAERHTLAQRQTAEGRLGDTTLYAAFALLSLERTGIIKDLAKPPKTKPVVTIVTALPVGVRTPENEARLKAVLTSTLESYIDITGISVQSEPNAVISHQMIDDNGKLVPEKAKLYQETVCVGDIGGSTANRSVLAGLRPIAGQSESPLLGSRSAIDLMARQSRCGFEDAEQRLRTALRTPGSDPEADAIIAQYRGRVVAEYVEAWTPYRRAPKVFAGGTTLWVQAALQNVFGSRCEIVESPQQAIVIGLLRWAMLQQLKAAAPAAAPAS